MAQIQPLLKESLTITHLRKLHRQGASKIAMARVAGTAAQFDYLDKRYGITREPEEDRTAAPIGMSVGEALGRPRRTFGQGRQPWTDKTMPSGVDDVILHIDRVFGLKPGVLVSKSSLRHLMAPRCVFVGVVRQLWPALDFSVIAHLLDRDPRMMSVYMRNHNQFYSSPDYTVKVERVLAAMSAEREIAA